MRGRGVLKTGSLAPAVLAVLMFLCVPYFSAAQEADRSSTSGADGSPNLEHQLPDEQDLMLAEEETGRSNGSESLSAFGIGDFIRMILVLGAVITVIYGLFLLLRKISVPRIQEGGPIRLVAGQSLPGGKYLHLVQVGRRLFLIGAGEGTVTLLSEIDDKESMDEIALEAAEAVPAGGSGGFARVLADLFRSGRGAKPGAGLQMQDPASLEFLRQQQERLKKLR